MKKTATDSFTAVRRITRTAQKQIKAKTGLKVSLIVCAPDKPGLTADQILNLVATALNMQITDFSSARRLKTISELRFIAVLFLRKHLPQMTLKQIGNLFGGMDHTSILYAYTKAKALLSIKDTSFTQKYVTALRAVNNWLAKEEIATTSFN